MERNEGGRSDNVVVLTLRRNEGEPQLSADELREVREWMAYWRAERPKLEAIKRGCPTARRLLDE